MGNKYEYEIVKCKCGAYAVLATSLDGKRKTYFICNNSDHLDNPMDHVQAPAPK